MKKKRCCISHEFIGAVSDNPNGIAIIEAYGGAQLSRDFRSSNSGGGGDDGAEAVAFFRKRAKSASPPMYDGDRCFTYAEVLDAVDSLSSRLISILSGADDSHLIRPSPSTQADNMRNTGRAKLVETSGKDAEYSAELESRIYTPKILGIFMPNSVEYVIAVLSVLRCGEAFMPLDPSWPKDRILSVVSSSKIDLIICSRSIFSENASHLLDGSHWLVEGSGAPVLLFSIEESPVREKIALANLVLPCDDGKERRFCYVMYTSGSTGKPKGVCGTEQGLLNRFLWMQEIYPLNGEELSLFKTPISFIDHMQEFLSAMLSSSVLVIPPMKKLKENIFSLVDFVQAYFINKLTAVPSLIRAIFPTLHSRYKMQHPCSLRLLVLSGEVLPLSVWEALSNLLPETTILNLYGSTEVSGDCTYFDCKRLSMILEKETLTSVPIGMPLSNCNVDLVGERDSPDQGEIYVSGPCICSGYYSNSTFIPLEDMTFPQNSIHGGAVNARGSQNYIRTGDFSRRLASGDLVFLGRKDRSIKVNGQRISLEEIEDNLRGHIDVVDAAVISSKSDGEIDLLKAFVVLKDGIPREAFRSSVRCWMVNKVSLAMIPNFFFCSDSIPMNSSGKVDYELLASSSSHVVNVANAEDEIGDYRRSDLLQVIKKAFCDALMVEDVSNNDDFFMMGGNSIAAAHVSHSLGVDMRLLYNFPSPFKLLTALLEKNLADNTVLRKHADQKTGLKKDNGNTFSSDNIERLDPHIPRQRGKRKRIQSGDILSKAIVPRNQNHAAFSSKCMEVESKLSLTSENIGSIDWYPWNSSSVSSSCAISRGNKVFYGDKIGKNSICKGTLSWKVLRGIGSMQELWKVHMESCVDASPLVVFKEKDVYLFIGSHSHKFVCVHANSGSIQWERNLEGRIECSAAITGDFSQVVVGCYDGKIYFLEFSSGNICWTFQTSGEVKSQPIADSKRHLIWCGSHDHNLYALDYVNRCCIYTLPCEGSLYGSPAIDEMQGRLYVASTSGHMSALSIKASPFHVLWQQNLGVPIFGSIAISPLNGHVICCLVDGTVLALDSSGCLIWKCRTDGPIFAGPCISSTLPSQVLICSRNGSIYSYELEKGDLLWEFNVGDPITASPYVDEHINLVSDPSISSDRLVCVCSSSGTMHLIRVNMDVVGFEKSQVKRSHVEEFARMDLPGDVFSSPLMIRGQVFVGCRDDYVHCVEIENENLL